MVTSAFIVNARTDQLKINSGMVLVVETDTVMYGSARVAETDTLEIPASFTTACRIASALSGSSDAAYAPAYAPCHRAS